VADMPPADMAMYVRSHLTWHAPRSAYGFHWRRLLMRPVSRGRISLDPCRSVGESLY